MLLIVTIGILIGVGELFWDVHCRKSWFSRSCTLSMDVCESLTVPCGEIVRRRGRRLADE